MIRTGGQTVFRDRQLVLNGRLELDYGKLRISVIMQIFLSCPSQQNVRDKSYNRCPDSLYRKSQMPGDTDSRVISANISR
jgi:hypothetical protein